MGRGEVGPEWAQPKVGPCEIQAAARAEEETGSTERPTPSHPWASAARPAPTSQLSSSDMLHLVLTEVFKFFSYVVKMRSHLPPC